MGFAASQARILLLTARKSDLEFRAQQITNSEMILAMQTESVAKEYSNAMSNTKVQMKILATQNGQDSKYEDISFANLYSQGYQPLVKGDNGNWIKPGDDGYEQALLTNGIIINTVKDQNGRYVSINTDHKFTESMLLTGAAGIMDPNGNITSVSGDPNIQTVYDTSDDASAQAKYDTSMAAIHVKEKQLQIDLEQIKNQQKACDTELDSIQKIIDKNIDRTFKVFS